METIKNYSSYLRQVKKAIKQKDSLTADILILYGEYFEQLPTDLQGKLFLLEDLAEVLR